MQRLLLIDICFNAASIGRNGIEHLFIKTGRTLQRHIEDAYKKAGITWGVGVPYPGHTCATWQLDRGISLEIVQENLGHEYTEITLKHLGLDQDDFSHAINNLYQYGKRTIFPKMVIFNDSQRKKWILGDSLVPEPVSRRKFQ